MIEAILVSIAMAIAYMFGYKASERDCRRIHGE